jgi:HAD superfamily hydrolase (TIGR01490 family)
MMHAIRVQPGVKQAAFFDLEKTLTQHSSEQECTLALARMGQLSMAGLARILWGTSRYNLGLISDFEEVKRCGAKIFEGRKFDRDAATVRKVFEEQLLGGIYPEAREWVTELRRRGFLLCIVSSTYRFIVEPYAWHLGIARFFGSELEVKGGVCTGQVDGPIYHQEKKAEVLRTLALEEGISLEHSYAFGDSLSDLPMLESVGHPVAVNPARGLRKMAEHRGWTTVRWSVPKRRPLVEPSRA